MTAIETVLLRKDIASLIVAIVAGMAVAYFLTAVTTPLSLTLTGREGAFVPEGESSFTTNYVQPIVAFGLQLAALEGLLRLVIIVRQKLYKA